MEVCLGPGHIVLDGDPAPTKMGHGPQFSAHICCGQTAEWFKMPLGAMVDLGAGNIVLDADPDLHPKGHSPPSSTPWGTDPLQFSAHVCCGQRDGWIKMPLDTKVRLGPGHTVTWGSSYPQKEAHPQFSAHVYCGQTVAHLSYCLALVAHLTAESPYILQWAPLSPKIAASHGGSGPPSNAWFLGPIRARHPNGTLMGAADFAEMTVYFIVLRLSPQNCPLPWGISTPSNTRLLGPTRVLNPNGISIALAVLAGLSGGSLVWQTDRPTDRPTDHVTRSVTVAGRHLRT